MKNRHAKGCTPPTKLACGGMQWLFFLEHHSFLFFFLICMNYNYIEFKTGFKGILERVTVWKNMSKASQNVFYVRIAILQSL